MLFNSQYLDEDALATYVAALEGGLRESGISRLRGSSGFGGSLGTAGLKLEANSDSESEDTLSLKDHCASRLRRLIDAGHAEPEQLGWIETSQPDIDFADAGIGALIEWECDVFIPDSIATISNREGLGDALKLMKSLMGPAKVLGLDMEGVPNTQEVDAMESFLTQLNISPVVVGDDSDTEWKVAGSLKRQWVRSGATFDDRARIIGKVKKRVKKGQWYPIASLPGMNLVARTERRVMERGGPKDASQEEQFIPGPLLVLDYLAIYS